MVGRFALDVAGGAVRLNRVGEGGALPAHKHGSQKRCRMAYLARTVVMVGRFALDVAGGAVRAGWVGKAGGEKTGDCVALRALPVEVFNGAVGLVAALAIRHARHGMVEVNDAPGLADRQQPVGKPRVKPARKTGRAVAQRALLGKVPGGAFFQVAGAAI